MEKQQKIVEMAKDICRHQNVCTDVCKPISACDALRYAERAVEAGYVKVVRCKECIYYRSDYECFDKACGRCDHPQQDCIDCFDMWLVTKPDDFCSYAEMKGADNDS